jgi:hypothetical protein
MRYSGTVLDVLATGKYGHADIVLISYDELYDLVEQAELLARAAGEASGSCVSAVEDQTKRPLHPALGGQEPYALDPQMLFALPIQ